MSVTTPPRIVSPMKAQKRGDEEPKLISRVREREKWGTFKGKNSSKGALRSGEAQPITEKGFLGPLPSATNQTQTNRLFLIERAGTFPALSTQPSSYRLRGLAYSCFLIILSDGFGRCQRTFQSSASYG